MPTIRLEPLSVEFVALEGETVMAAALRCGYRWPTVCNGQGLCTVCFIEVIDHPEQLAPMNGAETERLAEFSGRRFYQDPLRLACQARVAGNVTVRKKGVTVIPPAPGR